MTPSQIGHSAGQACLAKTRWTDIEITLVQMCVLSLLKLYGRCSAEFLTDRAKLWGFRPHDDRAFGPIYATLYRAGKIAWVDTTISTKGHGRAGARVWELA